MLGSLRNVDKQTLRKIFSPAFGQIGQKQRIRWMLRHLPSPQDLDEYAANVEGAGIAAIEAIQDSGNPQISAIAIPMADGLDKFLSDTRNLRDIMQRFYDAVFEKEAISDDEPLPIEAEQSTIDVLAKLALTDADVSTDKCGGISEERKMYLIWWAWKKSGMTPAKIRDQWNNQFPSLRLNPEKRTATQHIRTCLVRIEKLIKKWEF